MSHRCSWLGGHDPPKLLIQSKWSFLNCYTCPTEITQSIVISCIHKGIHFRKPGTKNSGNWPKTSRLYQTQQFGWNNVTKKIWDKLEYIFIRGMSGHRHHISLILWIVLVYFLKVSYSVNIGCIRSEYHVIHYPMNHSLL